MSRRIAFAGFRHGHINSLWHRVSQVPEFEISAVCEENPEALAEFREVHPDYNGPVYTSLEEMLASDCGEIVAVGDYYARRGMTAVRALQTGRHVIGDKPLCTSLAELDQIEALVKEKHLSVGCLLDLRTMKNFMKARELILSGLLGEIMQIQFTGQHPLMEDSRPHWYFEEGCHGGTINDIAIHAFDFIPWITGLEFRQALAARCWHTPNTVSGCFNAGAQMMAVLDNGCGVMGDVSYSQPTSFGYRMPQYWRVTVWGSAGAMEFNCVSPGITLWIEGEKEPRQVQPEDYTGPVYLDWFLMELQGKPAELNTEVVLRSARRALEMQQLADRKQI